MIRTLDEVERELIIEAITKTRGDTAQAAKLLGVSRTTVYRKLQHYGIVSDRSQSTIIFAKCK